VISERWMTVRRTRASRMAAIRWRPSWGFRSNEEKINGYGSVAGVSEKMFSQEQYEQLRSFPEVTGDELIRYFTLAPADVALVAPGKGRGPGDRLGLAVQLATLPWLGFGRPPTIERPRR
jgi:hypothetical protein